MLESFKKMLLSFVFLGIQNYKYTVFAYFVQIIISYTIKRVFLFSMFSPLVLRSYKSAILFLFHFIFHLLRLKVAGEHDIIFPSFYSPSFAPQSCENAIAFSCRFTFFFYFNPSRKVVLSPT